MPDVRNEAGCSIAAAPRRAAVAVVCGVALLLVGVGCSGSSGSAAGNGNGAAPTGGTTAPAGSTTANAAGLLDVATLGQVAGTDGRGYIADAQGRALQLRGFNIKTRDPLKDASDDLLAAGQQRGFDLLRLSVYWDQFEPNKDQYDQAYLDAVGTVLDRAASHGISVIIDFHQDVFGAKFGDHGVPLWATRDDGLAYTQHEVWLQNYLEPAVQAAWDHLYEDPDLQQAQSDAWVTVAKRFQNKPAVLGYDLLNEPFGKLRTGEDLVAAATRVQAVQLTAMYQRLSDAMHAADPTHWIFFEAPNVASLGIPVALGKINGTKLAYYPHMYDSSIESATYAPGGEVTGFDATFFDKYEKAIRDYPMQYGYPTYFGEWGIAHPDKPGMDEFVARSLALMDRIGSGWTVFNWCKGEGYCPLDKDGKDRVAIGQIVQPWARAIAGSPTSFTWDPKARTLTVVFKDSAATGTTDLFVPTTTYPEGFAVAASDAKDAWSSQTDTATNIVHVTTPKTGGTHTVCLAPKGSSATCAPA